jgi:hypothetical protein
VIEISGNEAGNLDGVCAVRQLMGAGSDMVTVIFEKGKAFMSVDLRFDAVELRFIGLLSGSCVFALNVSS